LFIYEKIWGAKKITDEDTKVAQLEITFTDRALDWYMDISTNNTTGRLTTVANVNI
jgi:hypothetical protein